MPSRITRMSPETVSLEAKWPSGEWKWVDEDWSDYTAQERQGHWLRTWNGVKQMLRWIPAQSTGTERDK